MIKALHIPPAQHTPKVVFDIEKLHRGMHVFEISGDSDPEDVRAFYEPLLKWLQELEKYFLAVLKTGDSRKRKIRLTFRMNYFNSSSAKHLFDIIQKMEEIQKKCLNTDIKAIWLYQSQDTDMFDAGEEFKNMTSLPFDLTAISREEG